MQTRCPSQGFSDTLRCIGCILARPEDGTLISASVIAACTGRERKGSGLTSIYQPLRWLVRAGLLQSYTPDEPLKMHPWGQWRTYQMHYFKPTPLGAEILPIQAQEECGLRNPFVRLTTSQERVIRCMRCIFSKTDNEDDPTKGGVTAGQIARYIAMQLTVWQCCGCL